MCHDAAHKPLTVAKSRADRAAVPRGKAPWRARRRLGLRVNRMARDRVRPTQWPPEPASPAVVSVERLARALEALCGWMPRGRARRYATWMRDHGARFAVDPFLLGALAYRQTEGSCRPDAVGPQGGVGLTAIVPRMFASQFRGRTLEFQSFDNGRWRRRGVDLGEHRYGPRLRLAETNLFVAAALLHSLQEQATDVNEAFAQWPHRHVVSHFIWGDRVRSDRQEDRVLTARRRLLQYYGAIAPMAPVTRWGVAWGSPLDGAPRVVSSGMGSVRDGGTRRHRGVDFESLPGEPVRAVADGRVRFAGVDLPGNRAHRQVKRGEYDRYPRRSLGSGGRFVCLVHGMSSPRDGRKPELLKSCYMHLLEVKVVHGDRVRRGDSLGTVGRTGMRSSAAHLHLEIHGEHPLNPLDVVGDFVVGQPDPVPRHRRR